MARIWIGLGGAEDTGQHGGYGRWRWEGGRYQGEGEGGVGGDAGGDQESSEGDQESSEGGGHGGRIPSDLFSWD